ncbi:MAG: histone deacetylase family protein, partial [Nitrososphaeria archaeon]|nr:histone deacetylase family protein [Nitrososphaeria archaeon]
DLLAVSAGFDTYQHDPVGGLGLSIESYYKIGRQLKLLNKKMFITLEGG